MEFFLHIPVLQAFSEAFQKPENITIPTLNYTTQDSNLDLDPMPLNIKIQPPIWRPFEDENPQKELYHCTVCKKTFKTKAHVEYHKFCSGGKKPFKCEDCEMEFIAKSHFEYHLRIHTGERPYACATCNKRFNQQGKLARHMKIHTGYKPFICGCGKGFVNPYALRQHTFTHTGERPFACPQPYCGKRFRELTNLKRHKVTHTGERRSYGLKLGLEQDKKTHESGRPAPSPAPPERPILNLKDLLRHSIIHRDINM